MAMSVAPATFQLHIAEQQGNGCLRPDAKDAKDLTSQFMQEVETSQNNYIFFINLIFYVIIYRILNVVTRPIWLSRTTRL